MFVIKIYDTLGNIKSVFTAKEWGISFEFMKLNGMTDLYGVGDVIISCLSSNNEWVFNMQDKKEII